MGLSYSTLSFGWFTEVNQTWGFILQSAGQKELPTKVWFGGEEAEVGAKEFELLTHWETSRLTK